MIGLEHYLILSGIIFSIGLYGALIKRNLVVILMCIELMFNGVNIAVVAMSRHLVPLSLVRDAAATTDQAIQMLLTGQVFAVFVITVAAAEVALGLGIILAIYRSRDTVEAKDVDLMRR